MISDESPHRTGRSGRDGPSADRLKRTSMLDALRDNSLVPGNAGAVPVSGRRGVLLNGVGAGALTRLGLLVALVVFAVGCGRDKPEVAAGQTLSEEALKQRCADPQWREKNLGIWYAVCRQPAAW